MALLDRLRGWARQLKLDVLTLWIAARDPQTPLIAKWVAGAVAAYALSPIDLIPDVIPIVGYLDDLILVPAGIWLALRLVPPAIIVSAREQAMRIAARPVSKVAATAIVLLWVVIAIWLLRLST